jgi:hypothetical protein
MSRPSAHPVAGLLISCAILLPPLDASAMTPVTLKGGRHVRATSVQGGVIRHHEGPVIQSDADSLVIGIGPSRREESVPWGDITRLEIRTRSGNRTTNAVVGLLIGATLGAGIGGSPGADGAETDWLSAGEMAVMGAVSLGLVGLLIGTVAGHGASWQDIGSPSPAISFTTSAAGHAGAFVGLRF